MRNPLPILVICCVVLYLGCASEKADFSEAEKHNSVEAYEAFLQKHPQGEFSQQATERIHHLAFQFAKQKDSLHVYQKYQTKYPESKFSSEVSNRIEELEYQLAKQKDDLDAYRAFKQAYPESKFSTEVKSRIEELAYQLAKQKDDKQNYQDFLDEFPESKYVRDIKKSIQNLSLPTYSEVLRTYPKDVKLTKTEVNIVGWTDDGRPELKHPSYVDPTGFFYYGAKVTIHVKTLLLGKVYYPGDKLTVDKDMNIIKVRSWK